MSVKEIIKKAIGQKGIEKVRGMKMLVRVVKAKHIGTERVCKIYRPAHLQKEFSIEGKNVFFGYYDLQQIDSTGRRLLLHICNKDTDTKKDSVDIVCYDLDRDKYVKIAESHAWAWQQGCRTRWNPLKKDEILFNNMADGHYVCQIWNVENKTLVKTLPIPLYDIDREMNYGLGVNFSRLQRLRPGYGYNTLPDETEGKNIPQNDGIIKYDFKTEKVKLLISYQRLCEGMYDANAYQHYINHISIAPDGQHFMFFHIYTKGAGLRWKVRMCVSDSEGKDIKVIEEAHTISHYTWRNSETLLTTRINRENKGSCYALYNTRTGIRTVIGGEELKLDGHPTFLKGGDVFISDTYPQKDFLQHVFLYDMKKQERKSLVDIYHTPRLYEEQRCDLHPRLTPDNKHFTIDTVYKGKRRSVLLFDLKV